MKTNSDSFAAMNSDIDASSGGNTGEATTPCGKKKKYRVWIAVKDETLDLVTGALYQLTAGSETFEGRVPDDGVITELLTGDATTGLLRVWMYGDLETEPVEWDLEIGAKDPSTIPSGAEQSLDNLGWTDSPKQLADFQETFGLEPTGNIDGPTIELLESVYSSATKHRLADVWRGDLPTE